MHCRYDSAVEVLASIARLKRFEARKAQSPNDPWVDEELRDEMKLLKRYTRPDAEYSAMARQLVERHYRKL